MEKVSELIQAWLELLGVANNLLPFVSVMNVEHHNSEVFIVIVELPALVPELCLHLDNTVEGVGGDEGLVPAVQLQQGGGVRPVQFGVENTRARTWVGEVLKVTAVELEGVGT